MEYVAKWTVLVVSLVILQHSSGRYLRPRPVHHAHKYQDEGYHGFGEESVRYSDIKKGYTVLRDHGMRACFITEYDPEWDLSRGEKQFYIDQKQPMVYRTRYEIQAFVARVGETIESLCHGYKIYWSPTLMAALRSGEDSAQGAQRAANDLKIPPPPRRIIAPRPMLQATPKIVVHHNNPYINFGRIHLKRKSEVSTSFPVPELMQQGQPKLRKELDSQQAMKPQPRRALAEVVEPPKISQKTPVLKVNL